MMNQKQKASAYDALKLVEKFNSLYPIGSKVMIRKIAIKSALYEQVTVNKKAITLNEIQPVASFEEISGYFSIEPAFVKYP